MTTYYLIVGNKVLQKIDTTAGDVVALPLLEAGKAMSLVNEAHLLTLAAGQKISADQAMSRLGLTDLRDKPGVS